MMDLSRCPFSNLMQNSSTNKSHQWGRSVLPCVYSLATTLALLLFSPIIVLCFILVNLHFSGSLFSLDLSQIYTLLPPYSSTVFCFYLFWIFFQLYLFTLPDLCHYILPLYKGGLQYGQITPAGNILLYNINGLQSWFITHLLFYLFCFYFNIIDPAIIAKHWAELFVATCIVAYTLSFIIYIKALYYPSHPEDNKITKYLWYDYFMGIEHNPRIKNFDFKLFFNGRIGIILWTLINLSFASFQFQKFNYISNSIILINLLHAIYVLDFFWNENWYLKTIDIAHDHFGWYLIFGDIVWLPFMYTLQSVYLAYNPIHLSTTNFLFILILGLFGYILFRLANSQKDTFRNNKNCLIAGKPPTYIDCVYKTSSGQLHHSKLLTSGLWGLARHMNYTGDLILSLAFCLTCGTNHILPYFYFVYMLILLVNRCYRDEHRCLNKYGHYWLNYCSIVPYRLIPYIY